MGRVWSRWSVERFRRLKPGLHARRGEGNVIDRGWAVCAEVPGANGQGESIEEAKESLREAIRLIFEDRLADMRRGLPDNAIQEVIAV